MNKKGEYHYAHLKLLQGKSELSVIHAKLTSLRVAQRQEIEKELHLDKNWKPL